MDQTQNSITQDELDSYRIGDISYQTEQRHSSEFKPCKGCWYLEDICAYVYIDQSTIYCKDLTNAMHRGLECPIYQLSEGIAYLTYSRRACNTYSPFAVVKPIQTPKKWAQAHVWKAILSGQIYRGKINHIYTDDYRMDALRDCCEDVELSAEKLIGMAKDLLTGESGYRVSATENEDGTAEIRLCGWDSSYTVYYDPARHR